MVMRWIASHTVTAWENLAFDMQFRGTLKSWLGLEPINARSLMAGQRGHEQEADALGLANTCRGGERPSSPPFCVTALRVTVL